MAELPQGVPVNEILQMRQQGMGNNQIVQQLQRMGYRSHQIFDAMNQADLSSEQDISGGQQPFSSQMPPPPVPGSQQHTGQQVMQEQPLSVEKIEEVVESIIEEKWEELIKNVNKIVEWKEASETRIVKMERDIGNLSHSFDELHKGVLGKMGEYEDSMSAVGSEIKALEKVFQKILPTLTENVNELSRITRDMKGKKG